ncbi:MAG TPA: cytochrome c maturation protein CcmE [Gammaproteobacteria bacterium]|nr:cytochrome c maturation protein CcmE [Gammaproteobacteria bacterium]
MKARHQRLFAVGLVLVGVGLGATFLLKAMNQNILYYYSPTQMEAGEAPEDRRFRVGGLVVDDSVKRTDGSMEVRFALTDEAHVVPVVYNGILPDLFREGQGIIAHGRMEGGEFVADEILAKHDENYMPPEVAASLDHTRSQQGAQGGYGDGK